MPERAGGDQRLDPVGQQVGLGGQPLRRVGPAGVGGHRVPALAQELGHLLGGRDGQRVDDAGPGQRVQLRGQPAQPLGRRGQRHHRQPQALPVQRAAQHQRSVAVGRAGVDRTEPELLGDVDDHPVVGRGRGGQHRDAGRQLGDQGAQPPVVGPEVVAPVGDAVRLVDHEQAGGRGEPGQHPIAEIGVVQPLRADQQQVDLAGLDRGVGALPVRGVGRVDRGRVDPGPPRGVDLVAHQRQQRRDDHRRARPGRPQQRGGHEVHRRLAPPGALHDQRPRPALHQRVDGRPLVVPQPGARAGQLGQHGLGPSRGARAAALVGCSVVVTGPMVDPGPDSSGRGPGVVHNRRARPTRRLRAGWPG